MGLSLAGLLGPIFGGVVVALTTYWTTRQRATAEIRKLDAEAEKTRAETSIILADLDLRRSEPRFRDELPRGWMDGGDDIANYELGIDHNVFHAGRASGFVRSCHDPVGFATLMQRFKADTYHGTRVRVSALIRTAEVLGWAGLWMRVDDGDGKSLAFDNMQDPDRRISGTRGWQRHAVVLAVPETSAVIAFGILLDGPGQVWIDDVEFEVVGEDVPSTHYMERMPLQPINLDFEGGTN
ncbi:hypothetical protein AB0D12_39720 [Streptomyces sp. NPDC048479]|uniref:hypothetical protein n=1 Tax=Streptomyces sp. NPDC048479 TaxID=3154725 RepID=UPI00344A42C7